MKVPKHSFLLLVLCVIAILSAGCRAGRTATATNLEQSLDDLVAPFLSNNSVPGMSLAVVENGHVIYAKVSNSPRAALFRQRTISYASCLQSFDGELISQTLVKEMFSVPQDGAFTPGWVFKARLPYGLEFDNNGAMEGATAFIDTVPDRRYALALPANRECYTAKPQSIVTEARRLVLDLVQ